MEKFTAPVDGSYKMECWGAQGDGVLGHPGSGGYAVGSINLSRLYSIYVCVGGFRNCYNNPITSHLHGAPGGGGTCITTTNYGELKNFKNKQNEVLLVAGGGGASEWIAYGGVGGGENGGDATTPAIYINSNGEQINISKSYGTGGTQDSGGTIFRGDYEITTLYNADFGVGGIAAHCGDFGSQGGGGWYGGGGSCYAGCAGGGSSHGNTSLLISNSYKTIDGAHKMPSPGGGTETGHSGHGACVISWILK